MNCNAIIYHFKYNFRFCIASFLLRFCMSLVFWSLVKVLVSFSVMKHHKYLINFIKHHLCASSMKSLAVQRYYHTDICQWLVFRMWQQPLQVPGYLLSEWHPSWPDGLVARQRLLPPEQKKNLRFKDAKCKSNENGKSRVPLSAGIHETPTCVEVQSCRSPAACRWSFLPGWHAWPESAGKGAHLGK